MRVVRALELCDECESIAPTVQVGNTRRYVFLCINCLGQAVELFAMTDKKPTDERELREISAELEMCKGDRTELEAKLHSTALELEAELDLLKEDARLCRKEIAALKSDLKRLKQGEPQ